MTALRALLPWYDANARDLPWRRTSDPYRVWLSEVMLQQTTVAVVIPYYERFLQRFPDLPALAGAAEEDVLACWSGLGYYHRGRNLQRAAQVIVERHGGVFPRTLEEALALPGVGPYTARAVLSIAYDVPLAVVDGNVRRVLSRVAARGGGEAAFATLADEVLDQARPGAWNQAVMELGATVCLPRTPRCESCPIAGGCLARAHGTIAAFPPPKPRRATVEVTIAAAVVERDGAVLLVRRAEGRLLGRFWEVPQSPLAGRGLADLVTEVRERYGLEVAPGELLGEARHAITYRRIRLEAYRAELARPLPRSASHRFVTAEELDGLPLSSLTRKALALHPAFGHAPEA